MQAQLSEFIDKAVERIQIAHDGLGHSHGWRFLYSARETFSPDTEIAFIGLNPGGDSYEPPVVSVEEGNAYRVETWEKPALQEQVRILFQGLADRLGAGRHWTDMLDRTLTSNFCPFRSQSWRKLANPRQSKRFSSELWSEALPYLAPRLVIFCGCDLLNENLFAPALASAGYVLHGNRFVPTGWGPTEFRSGVCAHGEKPSFLAVQLPHLARFKVMTSEACQSHVTQLLDEMALFLKGGVEI